MITGELSDSKPGEEQLRLLHTTIKRVSPLFASASWLQADTGLRLGALLIFHFLVRWESCKLQALSRRCKNSASKNLNRHCACFYSKLPQL